MEHTEGKYAIQDEGEYGMLDKMHILAPDGTRVATVDILDAPDVDHAYKIRDLLNAFNGISAHDALNIIQIGLAMKEALGDVPITDAVKYLEHGAMLEACKKLAKLEVK